MIEIDRPIWCPDQTCSFYKRALLFCGGTKEDKFRICHEEIHNKILLDKIDEDMFNHIYDQLEKGNIR